MISIDFSSISLAVIPSYDMKTVSRVQRLQILFSLLFKNTNVPGISENKRMHSLNPNDRRPARNCCSMDTPMHIGNDELPSNKVSHRWNILCNGNTSVGKNK